MPPRWILLVLFASIVPSWAGGIYWTNRGRGLVERARYDGAEWKTLVAEAGGNVRGIALDLADNRIFYNDNGGDVLYRLKLDGTGREAIFNTTNGQPGSFPADLRLDLSKQLIYYCDQQKGEIVRISTDGTRPKVIVQDNTFQPYYLDLDLAAGKLYWGDFDGVTANTGNVFRANLDGTDRETIVTGTLETRAVCLDAAGAMLYWVNRNAGKIQRCPLSALPVNAATSAAVQTLYQNLDTPHGMVLDPSAGKLYWVDTATNNFENTIGDRAVSRGDMDGSGPHEVIVDLQSDAWDIEIDPRCANYAEWVARFFQRTPGPKAERLADPDGDGWNNLLEYAFGTHPLRKDAAPDFAAASQAGISINRRAFAADLEFTVEFSADLVSWKAIEENEALIKREGEREQVAVPTSASLNSEAMQFLRVRVRTR